MAALVETLPRDAAAQFRRFGIRRVPTVYIGGGTPSMLGAPGIRALLSGLAAALPNTPEELTVELNPESTGAAFLEACREGGVTRLSLGVQTFHQASRRLVRRVGEGAALGEKLALAASYYGGAFSADLIAGLPGQDEGVLRRDIAGLLAFKPAHVSLYSLTREPGTPLAEPRFDALLPPEDEADRLWILGRDLLEEAGYGQYEVSNFALPGKESRHNIRYWRMENWLGAGPAASGTLIDEAAGRGRRYTHPPDLDGYLRGAEPRAPLPEEEALDRFTLMEETLMMGFRYIRGPDRALFKRRFHRDLEDCIPQSAAKWRDRGLFEPEKTALNKKGLLYLNAFLRDALGELEREEGEN
jgi:oxygen-independent coproporphyrinogen-3 oxidase